MVDCEQFLAYLNGPMNDAINNAKKMSKEDLENEYKKLQKTYNAVVLPATFTEKLPTGGHQLTDDKIVTLVTEIVSNKDDEKKVAAMLFALIKADLDIKEEKVEERVRKGKETTYLSPTKASLGKQVGGNVWGALKVSASVLVVMAIVLAFMGLNLLGAASILAIGVGGFGGVVYKQVNEKDDLVKWFNARAREGKDQLTTADLDNEQMLIMYRGMRESILRKEKEEEKKTKQNGGDRDLTQKELCESFNNIMAKLPEDIKNKINGKIKETKPFEPKHVAAATGTLSDIQIRAKEIKADLIAWIQINHSEDKAKEAKTALDNLHIPENKELFDLYAAEKKAAEAEAEAKGGKIRKTRKRKSKKSKKSKKSRKHRRKSSHRR